MDEGGQDGVVAVLRGLGHELVDFRQIVIATDSAPPMETFRECSPMLVGEGGVAAVAFVSEKFEIVVSESGLDSGDTSVEGSGRESRPPAPSFASSIFRTRECQVLRDCWRMGVPAATSSTQGSVVSAATPPPTRVEATRNHSLTGAALATTTGSVDAMPGRT